MKVRLAPGWALGPTGEDIPPPAGTLGGAALPVVEAPPRPPLPPLARAVEHALDAVRELATVAKRDGYLREAELALESLRLARAALEDAVTPITGAGA